MSAQARILSTLEEHADDTGVVRLTTVQLAREAACSTRMVRYSLAGLREDGLVEERGRDNASRDWPIRLRRDN